MWPPGYSSRQGYEGCGPLATTAHARGTRDVAPWLQLTPGVRGMWPPGHPLKLPLVQPIHNSRKCIKIDMKLGKPEKTGTVSWVLVDPTCKRLTWSWYKWKNALHSNWDDVFRWHKMSSWNTCNVKDVLHLTWHIIHTLNIISYLVNVSYLELILILLPGALYLTWYIKSYLVFEAFASFLFLLTPGRGINGDVLTTNERTTTQPSQTCQQQQTLIMAWMLPHDLKS